MARGARANALAGKIAVCKLARRPFSLRRFHPVDGSQLNLRVNNQMKKMPARKPGIESAAVVKADVIRSKYPPSRYAAKAPIGIANKAAIIVAKRANQNENEKVRITENINDLTIVLNRLVEKLDEDRSVKDHLITISTVLKNLGEQNTDKISELQSNLTIELRAISKQLSEIEKSSKKQGNNG